MQQQLYCFCSWWWLWAKSAAPTVTFEAGKNCGIGFRSLIVTKSRRPGELDACLGWEFFHVFIPRVALGDLGPFVQGRFSVEKV